MYSIKDEQFEGPLDLLLSLIEKEKLDITRISLAKITESYLESIKELSGSSADLAEFLLIAAKLLYLKSKELIPSIASDEEESEIDDLEERLREYQKYKQAANHFDTILSGLNRSYKKRSKSEKLPVFTPPTGVDAKVLLKIFNEVVNKAEEVSPREAVIEQEKQVTIPEKRQHILKRLGKNKKVSFREILEGSKTKPEIIVTFLAILEMIKQKEIRAVQEGNFSDLTLFGVK